MENTGAPRGTGERGNGVGSVVFIHKATPIMVSSVLFLTILVFSFNGNKIQLSDRRSHVNFLGVRHIFLHCSFSFCLTSSTSSLICVTPKKTHFCERAVYNLLISYNSTCPNRYIPVTHCPCDYHNMRQSGVPFQSEQDVV